MLYHWTLEYLPAGYEPSWKRSGEFLHETGGPLFKAFDAVVAEQMPDLRRSTWDTEIDYEKLTVVGEYYAMDDGGFRMTVTLKGQAHP